MVRWAIVPARKGASQGGGEVGRQTRRLATRTAYLPKKINRAEKSLDWVVNIVSLIAAREGLVFNLGKDAALPSGGSIMTTHINNQAGDSPAASTDTNVKETRRQQSPWPAVEVSKLREALAEVAKATKPSSPAIDFGRYVRREVDLAPDSAAGVLAMGKFLRLDPVGKAIEKLESRVAATEADTARLRRPARKPDAPKDGRKKDVCHALAKLKKKVLQELKDGGSTRTEAEEALIPELKSKSPAQLSSMLKEKLGIIISGRTVGAKNRRGEYKSLTVAEWSMYRSIPGVRPPADPLPGSVDIDDKDPEDQSRRRATDRSRIDVDEAAGAISEIGNGKLRQASRACSGYGRLRRLRADGLNERQADAAGGAILNGAKLAPNKVEFRPIEGRPPATGKDRD